MCYVDDLTLSGRRSLHDEFRGSLSQKVELEPFVPLTRVLGRCHRFVCWQQKKVLALESADFAKQCVQLYESVASSAVKPQLTPHLDVSMLPAADDETRGQLTESPARILMKILWLARLSPPDLLVAVTTKKSPTELGSCVRGWASSCGFPSLPPCSYPNIVLSLFGVGITGIIASPLFMVGSARLLSGWSCFRAERLIHMGYSDSFVDCGFIVFARPTSKYRVGTTAPCKLRRVRKSQADVWGGSLHSENWTAWVANKATKRFA